MVDRIELSIMEMVDREAIRNVIVAYYDAIWRDDTETVVQLFASDGVMEVSNGPLGGNAPMGHEQLRKFYTEGVKLMKPRPFGHNHVVHLCGNDIATGRSYVELRSSIDFSWVAAVVYEDEYIKVDGKWMIQKRRAKLQSV